MLSETRRPVRQNSYGAGDQDPMDPATAPQPTVIIGAPGPVMQQAQDAGQPMPGSPGIQSSTAPAATGPDAHPMDPGPDGGPAPMHPTDPLPPTPAAGAAGQTHQPDYQDDLYSPEGGGNYQDIYAMKHMRRGPVRRKGPIKPPPIKPHDPIDPVPPPQPAPVAHGIAGTDTTTAGIQYGPHYEA